MQVQGSFRINVGILLFLMFWPWIQLIVFGLSLICLASHADTYGQVQVHVGPLCNLLQFVDLWLDVLEVNYKYGQVVGIGGGVTCGEGCVEVASIIAFSSHLRRGYSNNMSMDRLRVSLCMALLLICIGGLVPKCTSKNEVVEYVQCFQLVIVCLGETLGLLLGLQVQHVILI